MQAPNFSWNAKPKNGQKCFFTESSYARWLGEDSHETRLAEGLKKIGIALPMLPDASTPLKANSQQQQQQKVGRADDKNDGSHNTILNRSDTSSSTSSKSASRLRVEDEEKCNEVLNLGGTSSIGTSKKSASLSITDSNDTDIRCERTGQLKSLNKKSEDVERNKRTTVSSDIDMSPVKQSPISDNSNKPGFRTLPHNEMDFKLENENHSTDVPNKGYAQDQTNVAMVVDSSQGPVRSAKKEPIVPHEVTKSARPSLITPFTVYEEKQATGEPIEQQETEPTATCKRSSWSKINTYNKSNRHIPLISKKRPLYKKSRFSLHEQKLYLELLRKYGKGPLAHPTPAQEVEMKQWEALSKNVKDEQKRFQSYLKYVSTQCKEDYLYIHAEAEQYVKEKLLGRRQKMLQCPRYYNFKQQIVLADLQEPNDSPNLNYVRPLLELGSANKMLLPIIIPGHPQPCTPIQQSEVTKVYPPIKPQLQGTCLWKHEECSRDVNAEQLAIPNKCDIVLSSGSLKYLIDTQDRHAHAWDMPFTIREYDVMEGEKKVTHKVVYIDKPLTKESKYTVKDKNSMFQKSALLAVSAVCRKGFHVKGRVFSNIKPSVTDKQTKKYDELQKEINDLEQSWEIPTDTVISSDGDSSGSEDDNASPNQKWKKKKKCKKPKVTQMGVFGVMQDIDELETFGADLKLMSKSSDSTISGPKQKMSIESEMELLKGIKEKAKKDINSPQIKQCAPEMKQPAPFLAAKDKSVPIKKLNLMETEISENDGKESVYEATDNGVSENSKDNKVHTADNCSEVEPKVEIDANENDMLECSESVHVEDTNTKRDIVDSNVEKDMKDSNEENNQSVLKHKLVAKKSSSSLSDKMKQMSEITSKLKLRSLQKDNSMDVPKENSSKTIFPKTNILVKNSPVKASEDSDSDSENEGLVMDVPGLVMDVPEPAEVLDAPGSPGFVPASTDLGPSSPLNDQPASPNQSIMAGNENDFVEINVSDPCLVIAIDDEDTERVVRDDNLKSEENSMVTTAEKDVDSHPVEIGDSLQNDCKSMEVDANNLDKELEQANQDLSGVKTRWSKRRSENCLTEDVTQSKRALRSSTISLDESIDSSANQPRRAQRRSSLDINTSKLSEPQLEMTSECSESSPESKTAVVSKRITRSRSTSTEKTIVKSETTEKRVTRQSSGQAGSTNALRIGTRITRRSQEQLDSPAVDGATTSGLSETRGTKRTSTDSLTDVNPQETITVKRKRGRPPKKKIVEKTSEIAQPVEEGTGIVNLARSDEISDEQTVHDEIDKDSNPGTKTMTEVNKGEASVIAEDNQDDNDETIAKAKRNVRNDTKCEQMEVATSNPKSLTRTMSTRRSKGVDYNEIETDEMSVDSVNDRFKAEHERSVVQKYVEVSVPRKRGRPPSAKTANSYSLQKAEATKIKQMVNAMRQKISDKSAGQTECLVNAASDTPKQCEETAKHQSIDSNRNNRDVKSEKASGQYTDSNRNDKDLESEKSVNNAENVEASGHFTDSNKNNRDVESEKSVYNVENVGYFYKESTKAENSAYGNSSAAYAKTANESGVGIDKILGMQSQTFKPPDNTTEGYLARHQMSQVAFPADGNVTYHQWSLGDLGLLIRSRYHGYANPQGLVYVSPKLEYQPYFGFERETISEVARNWISIYTRPNSTLVRARINPFNSEVMMVEYVQYPDLIPPGHPFSPAKAFADLQQVLQKMKQLPCGQYLLKNNPSKNRRLTIMEATHESGLYDLHYHHSSLAKFKPPFPIQWRPIDTQLLLQHHKKMNLIPCTYTPHDLVFGDQKKGKKKKGKKKKGKQQSSSTHDDEGV